MLFLIKIYIAMSKFFLTNSEHLFSAFKQGISKSSYKLLFEYAHNNIFALTTQKLFVENQNALLINDGFILENGTIVYNKRVDMAILQDIYHAYNADVNVIRNDALGNYALGILKEDTLTVFTEQSNCYDIFYYADNDIWVISSSLYDLVEPLREKLSINRLNVLEWFSRYAILNDETVFNEVKRLSGEEYIQVVDNQFNIKKIALPIEKITYENYEDNVLEIASIMRNDAKIFSHCLGEPTLGATGGLDSRMSLAAFLAAGSKPKLTYGLGNSILAISKEEDKEIDKLLSDKFHLNFEEYPWNETLPLDKYWDHYTSVYGDGIFVYQGCDDAMKFFEDSREPYVIYGYWGELYRETDWINKYKKDVITVEEFLDGWYYESQNRNIIDGNPDLKLHIKNKIINICSKYGLDPKAINKDDVFYFYMEYRKRADVHTVNLLNRMKYCHYLMSEFEIVRRAYIPVDKKLSATFMLEILNKLYRESLEIPFFSHCKKQKYLKNKMKLVDCSWTLKQRISKLLSHQFKERMKCLLGLEKTFAIYPSYIADLVENPKNKKLLCNYLSEDSLLSAIEELNYNNDIFLVKLVLQIRIFDKLNLKIADK